MGRQAGRPAHEPGGTPVQDAAGCEVTRGTLRPGPRPPPHTARPSGESSLPRGSPGLAPAAGPRARGGPDVLPANRAGASQPRTPATAGPAVPSSPARQLVPGQGSPAETQGQGPSDLCPPAPPSGRPQARTTMRASPTPAASGPWMGPHRGRQPPPSWTQTRRSPRPLSPCPRPPLLSPPRHPPAPHSPALGPGLHGRRRRSEGQRPSLPRGGVLLLSTRRHGMAGGWPGPCC